MEVEKAFVLIVLSVSLWTALSLFMDGRGYRQLYRYFAVLLVVLCISQLYLYLILIGSPWYQLTGSLALASIWLKGPLTYIFVYSFVYKNQPPRHFMWHFSAFPIAVLMALLVPQWQSLVHIFGAVTLLGYLCYALILVCKQSPRFVSVWAHFKNSAAYWLLWLIAGMALLIVADIAITLSALVYGNYPFSFIKVITYAVSVYLIAIACGSLFRPSVLFVANDEAADQVQQPALTPEPTLRALELGDSVASALHQKLEYLMKHGQLYRENELSLKAVAESLGISTHQASELLNVHMATNFYAYINRFRLSYASQLLKDPKCQMRVLDIAFEVGFNNKNSFYKEFRQVYGVTPTQYRVDHHAAACIV